MIPEWFEHNFVNIENLLVDMFSRILPDVDCGVWTPDDWLDDAEPDPMLTIVRLPGGRGVCWDESYDECFAQIVATTLSRELSIELISVVRSVLLPMSGFKWKMADGYTAQIHSVDEVAGPQMLTGEQQIDTRVVPTTFRIRVGFRSRKRYDQIIRDL